MVVYGAPGSPLLQLVRTPAELAADPSLRLNVEYYVCRALAPALSRCLSLLSLGSSADPLLWWKQLPRTPASATGSSAELPAVSSLHRFVSAAVCCVCGTASAMSGTSLCRSCSGRPQFAVHQVVTRLRQSQRALCRLGEVSTDYFVSYFAYGDIVVVRRAPMETLCDLPDLKLSPDHISLLCGAGFDRGYRQVTITFFEQVM